jgi:hypothetical protein
LYLLLPSEVGALEAPGEGDLWFGGRRLGRGRFEGRSTGEGSTTGRAMFGFDAVERHLRDNCSFYILVLVKRKKEGREKKKMKKKDNEKMKKRK